MGDTLDLQAWLRRQCEEFVFHPEGVYVANGEHDWPLVAGDAPDLTAQLEAGGHLVSLPKESAALANTDHGMKRSRTNEWYWSDKIMRNRLRDADTTVVSRRLAGGASGFGNTRTPSWLL